MNVLKKTAEFLAKSVAVISTVSLIYGRTDIELARFAGIMPNKYKDKTVEQLVKEVDTWKGAKKYILSHLSYKPDERLDGQIQRYAPLVQTHALGDEDCDGGASAGAALLSDDDKYACYAMTLISRDKMLGIPVSLDNHCISLVYDKETEKYGSLGINKVDCLPPKFDSPNGVFNAVNVAFGLMFEYYNLQEYDKDILVNGKHFVDDEIEFNKKYNNGETTFALDLASPNDDTDSKRYAFFTSPPEKYFTYDDWFEVAKDMPLYDSAELDSVSDAYSVYVLKGKTSFSIRSLDVSSFNYPYSSTIKSFSEVTLEDLTKLNKLKNKIHETYLEK
ncbi:MAG: hypothetical protein ACP5N2_00500 [Candidatus Nanoarchaeia archaeon]